MPRICLLTTSFPRFDGDEASVFLQRLVEGYTEAGARGVVVVPCDRNEPARGDCCGEFDIIRFRYGVFRKGALAFGSGIMPNIRRRPGLLMQAPLLLGQLAYQVLRLRKRIDAVHANWALALLAAWIAKKIAAIPYIVTVRGEDLKLLTATGLRYLFLPALRGAHAIVSVNQIFIDQIESLGIGDTPCIVIANGVTVSDVDQHQARKFIQTRPFAGRNYLLFVGTIVPRKSVEKLFQLLNLPRFRDHVLVLCGRLEDKAYVDSLQAEVRSLALEGRVFFEGAVAPAQIALYLASADLYVSASTFEGRPNAVLEAMAAGKVCLVSDIAAHREIITHGVNGLLCSFANPGGTHKAFEGISEESMLRMAERAKDGLRACTWKACAEAYLNLFNSLAPADRNRSSIHN